MCLAPALVVSAMLFGGRLAPPLREQHGRRRGGGGTGRGGGNF